MAVTDVKKIYQDVIADVCTAVREALSEEGYDDHTLQELRNLWLERLENSKALEALPTSIVDQVTNREYRHPTSGDTNNSSTLNNKSATGMKQISNRIPQASNSAMTSYNTNFITSNTINPTVLSSTNSAGTQYNRPAFPPRPTNPTNLSNTTMKTANQLDGTNDEEMSETCTKKTNRRKKKSKIIEISFQLDGTGPPVGDDDDDDEESDLEGNDVGENLDDDDDEDGTEEGKEDPNPLCSDDDVSTDEEPVGLFETDNVVVCQYDKISRTKNKWRFILKSGVMHLEGRDYVFSKANGDADW